MARVINLSVGREPRNYVITQQEAAVSSDTASSLLTTPPASPHLFGSAIYQNSGESYTQAFVRTEGEYGPMKILRSYLSDSQMVNGPPSWGMTELTPSTGIPVHVSIKGQIPLIPNGTWDSKWLSFFQGAPTTRDIYWTLFHEPDDNVIAGEFTCAQYRDAFTHVAAIAKSVGNPRLHSAIAPMNWTLLPDSGRAWGQNAKFPHGWIDLYAGHPIHGTVDNIVDVVAWDVNILSATYKAANLIYDPVVRAMNGERWNGSTFITDPTYKVNARWAVAEWGCGLLGGDTGPGRAAWMLDCGRYLRSSQALYSAYFNNPVGGESSKLLDQPSKDAMHQLCTGAF